MIEEVRHLCGSTKVVVAKEQDEPDEVAADVLAAIDRSDDELDFAEFEAI
jgi:hypothetical protein